MGAEALLESGGHLQQEPINGGRRVLTAPFPYEPCLRWRCQTLPFGADGVDERMHRASPHFSFAPYAFTDRFEEEGQVFASSAWVAEIAMGGEEGIRVEAHASDTDKPKLVLAILLAIQEGRDINWEQPWRNTVDYITDADHPDVIITFEDGTISEEVHSICKGGGVYEAERLFSVDEVGCDGREYDVTFLFTDPYNGAQLQNEEHFHLHISAPH